MEWAHSANSRGQRQSLREYLRNVATLAGDAANAFGARQLGHCLGLWHDVGKFSPEFQRYLLSSESGTSHQKHGLDHKAAGAKLAYEHGGTLALLVQGHHGGLMNRVAFNGWFEKTNRSSELSLAVDRARQDVQGLERGGRLRFLQHIDNSPRSAEFYLRMLFSALVDADFLDTEAHFAQAKSSLRGAENSIRR